MQETWVRFLGWEKSPGKGNGKPTPVFLPGKSHGQWRLAACSPSGHRVKHNLATKEPQQSWIFKLLSLSELSIHNLYNGNNTCLRETVGSLNEIIFKMPSI